MSQVYKFKGMVRVIQRTEKGVYVKSENSNNNFWFVAKDDWERDYQEVEEEKKDYCTWFQDTFLGIYIGDCCKIHDEECSTHKFFNCLQTKLNSTWSTLITTSGAIGCWFKYTSKMFKKAFSWLSLSKLGL